MDHHAIVALRDGAAARRGRPLQRRAQPDARRSFTHNSPLEVAWTIVPIVILVFIGAFSLPVLFEEQEIPEGDIHIKATGYQWFWDYEYLDEACLRQL